MPERRAYKVIGRVQGVGFRAWTLRRARQLGLAGYVRNAPDGSVIVEAEGDESRLAELEALLAQGPPYAVVREVVRLPPGERELPASFDVAF